MRILHLLLLSLFIVVNVPAYGVQKQRIFSDPDFIQLSLQLKNRGPQIALRMVKYVEDACSTQIYRSSADYLRNTKEDLNSSRGKACLYGPLFRDFMQATYDLDKLTRSKVLIIHEDFDDIQVRALSWTIDPLRPLPHTLSSSAYEEILPRWLIARRALALSSQHIPSVIKTNIRDGEWQAVNLALVEAYFSSPLVISQMHTLLTKFSCPHQNPSCTEMQQNLKGWLQIELNQYRKALERTFAIVSPTSSRMPALYEFQIVRNLLSTDNLLMKSNLLEITQALADQRVSSLQQYYDFFGKSFLGARNIQARMIQIQIAALQLQDIMGVLGVSIEETKEPEPAHPYLGELRERVHQEVERATSSILKMAADYTCSLVPDASCPVRK